MAYVTAIFQLAKRTELYTLACEININKITQPVVTRNPQNVNRRIECVRFFYYCCVCFVFVMALARSLCIVPVHSMCVHTLCAAGVAAAAAAAAAVCIHLLDMEIRRDEFQWVAMETIDAA